MTRSDTGPEFDGFVADSVDELLRTAVRTTTERGTHTQRFDALPPPPPGGGRKGSVQSGLFSTGGPGKSRGSAIQTGTVSSSRP